MKKLILLTIVGFALLAGYWVAKGFLDAMLDGKRSPRSQLSLAEIAKHANASLPRQIDSNTRDREIAGPGNRMTYQYTLLNVSVADIDIAELTARVRPEMIEMYRSTRSGTLSCSPGRTPVRVPGQKRATRDEYTDFSKRALTTSHIIGSAI